jgi:hypothetical protein
MGYKKGLAIYIDILGTKTYDFCNLYKLNQIFHKELFKLKNKQTLCQKFVTSFSDCAYIIYTINEKDECDETAFRLFIHDSLEDLNYIISTFFVNGFMCRGGISYGELYFEENNNFIFGPAINEAYKLETEAMMPRIIFDDKLGAKLYEKENTVIKDKFRKLIGKDMIDNRYFLNYISLFSIFDDSDFDEGLVKEKIQLGDEEYSFNDYYDKLIFNSKKEIKKTNDHSIISKHKWQLRYLRQYGKIIQ